MMRCVMIQIDEMGARSPNLARAREDARVSHLLGGIDEVGVLSTAADCARASGENDLLRESLEDVEVDDFVLARFLREHGLEEEEYESRLMT